MDDPSTKRIWFVVLIVFCGIQVAAICPDTDTTWGSPCGGSVQNFTLNWVNYPTSACQEFNILIPANYPADTCNWRVELDNIPSAISTAITVNSPVTGEYNAADTLIIASEFNGVYNVEFNDTLDALHASPQYSSVSPADGEADAVEIMFESVTGHTGLGFTIRVVLYAREESVICGDIATPNTIVLTDDYPKAVFVTPNFPSNYPMSVTCYSDVTSPTDSYIRIDYIAMNLRQLEDYLIIFDTQTPGDTQLLRIISENILNADGLIAHGFSTDTNSLQLVFEDGGKREDPGLLLLLTMEEVVPNTLCSCNCSTVTSIASVDEQCAGIDPLPRFVNTTVIPNDTFCEEDYNLDWGEDSSHIYLATPGFNEDGTYLDTLGKCRWNLFGPAGSSFILVFMTFNIASRDYFQVILNDESVRMSRFTSNTALIDFNNGTDASEFNLIDNGILLEDNDVKIVFRTRARDVPPTGMGVSFEIRLLDNSCDHRCLNGAQCTVCCPSGYFNSPICDEVIKIHLSSSDICVTEGNVITVTCTADYILFAETEVVLEVSTSSTAIEGPIFDIVDLQPCIIHAGEISGTVTVYTINDNFLEQTETLILDIEMVNGGGAPTAGNDNTPISILITDTNDTFKVSVDFSNDMYIVPECIGTFTGTIVFTGGNNFLPIPESDTINLSYNDAGMDTAIDGDDYTSLSTVSVTQSQSPVTSSVTFEIPINNEMALESTETFEIILTLGSPVSTEVGDISTTTVWIIDDDWEENIIIVDFPEMHKDFVRDLHLFAFTSKADSRPRLTWTKEDSGRPFGPERSNLIINGIRYGHILTFALRNRQRARRLGHYKLQLGSNPAINAFVQPPSECLMTNPANTTCTITVYRDDANNKLIEPDLTIGLSENCGRNTIWKKDHTRTLSNQNPTYTVSTVRKARGIFTISRRNVEGFFVMVEVIIADCPEGRYGAPACNDTCPECKNGGVCEEDGTCTCPPCFTGDLCQLSQREAGTFGRNQRIKCRDLHSDVSHREHCRGFKFCYGGRYGCSCGCGWHGLRCNDECDPGLYGADCKQECSCSVDVCDRFVGCPFE